MAAFRRLTIDDVAETILDEASGRKVKARPVDVPHLVEVDLRRLDHQRREEHYTERLETAINSCSFTSTVLGVFANAYVAGKSRPTKFVGYDLVPVQFYRVDQDVEMGE